MGDGGHHADKAGRYRGTVPLGTPLPDWPWELVLTALDVWEGCFELRGTVAFDRAHPFRSPGSWAITTNRETVHATHGGGGHGSDPSYWHVSFVPSLPDDATEIRVFTGPPMLERTSDAPSLPREPTLVIDLPGWPSTPKPARASLQPATTLATPAPSGPLPGLIHRPVQPDRVIPVSARLEDLLGDDLLGREVCVLSLEAWPTCFDVHVGGSGWWPLHDRSPGHRRYYAAQDDRGGRYLGRPGGSSSGLIWCAEFSFVPALDPAAAALTLELPDPLGQGRIVSATVELAAPR